MAVTLAEIMLDAKDLADLLNNPVVGDPTWRRWINQGQERLYRLLRAKAPERFHAAQTFTLTGSTNTVALVAGFRGLREGGVTRDPSSQASRRTLRRFNFAERDAQGRLPAWGALQELAYDIQDSTLVIEPAALAPGNYAYYYVLGPTPWLTNGTQDSVAIATLLEPYVDFIAHYAAIKGAAKDESDTAELRRDFAELRDEIQAEFGSTDDPSTIIDVEAFGS